PRPSPTDSSSARGAAASHSSSTTTNGPTTPSRVDAAYRTAPPRCGAVVDDDGDDDGLVMRTDCTNAGGADPLWCNRTRLRRCTARCPDAGPGPHRLTGRHVRKYPPVATISPSAPAGRRRGKMAYRHDIDGLRGL